MARPKKHPDELKQMISISLTKAEIKELDKNVDYIRQSLIDSYELSEDQIRAFNAVFNRSAVIGEFIGLMASKAGYSLLLGSMISALDSLGFQKKDNDTRSMF